MTDMSYPMTTWRKEISLAMEEAGDTTNILFSTLTEEELDKEFDGGYGSAEGVPFTLWTEENVYFPVVYDGSEWVGYVPRNPCDKKTRHQGGQ